jgi:hypothetical protein
VSESGITGSDDELAALERRLARFTVENIAKDGARAIGAVARRQYRAGQGPDGAPWVAKDDGSKALANAPKDVTFAAHGGAIVGTAPFHYRFHRAKRPVFPPDAGPMPEPWEKALIEAATKRLEGK